MFDGRRLNVQWHSCRTRCIYCHSHLLTHRFLASALLGHTLHPTHKYSRPWQTSRVAIACTTSATMRLPTGRGSSIPTFRAPLTMSYVPMFLLTLIHTHSLKFHYILYSEYFNKLNCSTSWSSYNHEAKLAGVFPCQFCDFLSEFWCGICSE